MYTTFWADCQIPFSLSHMVTEKVVMFALNFRHGNVRNLPLKMVISASSRSYCMQKCWEEKSYDEEITSLIGNREMVGYGWNGNPCYCDRADFPFPSIRYKEQTPELMALKEKERGDWRLLSIDDKKELYRASYCQTFAEFKFPYSTWMAIVGWALMFCSVGIWAFIFIHYFVYNPKPVSFTAPYKKAYLKRVINLHVNPITGISSKWDYENKKWKSRGLLDVLFGPPPNPFEDDEEVEEHEKERGLGGESELE